MNRLSDEEFKLSMEKAIENNANLSAETVKAMQNSNPKPSGGAPGNSTNSKPTSFAEAFQQHWPGKG